MAKFSALDLEKWVEKRILGFFNQANSYTDITLGLMDSPENGGGYVVGEIVAERIMDRKSALPRNKFTDLSQFDNIAGLGEDKLRDIVYTLGMPAAEAFRQAMYEEAIGENWDLNFHSVKFEDDLEFQALVADEKCFRRFVADEAAKIALRRFKDPKAVKKARRRLARSWMETFEMGHVGSYALALWFYRFDTDNWFSYELVQEVCESYLDFFPLYYDRCELRLFKGFQNAGLLAQAVTVTDLPVVVNHAEQRITLWTAQLSD